MKKIIFFIILAAIVSGVWIVTAPPGSDESEKSFVINRGEGVKEISFRLKEQNFIKNCFIFETYIWLKKIQSRLQAGEHKLRENMRFWEITESLIKPSGPDEQSIKILEGWNNREIASYLDKEGVIGKEKFIDEIDKYSLEATSYDFLDDRPEGMTLEGYLFPDTYRIYKEISQKTREGENRDKVLIMHIVKKMLDNFDQKLTPELRAEIARQKKTVFEIVTMASIIEKEARGEDMYMVSDIFWRRIQAGMPLQSDATVNYATGKYETQPSLNDLKIDSRYNTYKYAGLPKGPIGNPGIEAIKSAIYPKDNNYWYFLHARDDGRIIYSRNFEEHKANKSKYLP